MRCLTLMAALVLILAAVGCGGGKSPSRGSGQGGSTGGQTASLPSGCQPSQVRAVLEGFFGAVGSGEAAVARYLVPQRELVGFTVYVDEGSGRTRLRGESAGEIYADLARVIGRSDEPELLGAEVGPVGPLAHDSRYAISKRSTAGVEFVLKIGPRSITGKAGISCRDGAFYSAAMGVEEGLSRRRVCGAPIDLRARLPRVCEIHA